MKFFIQILTIFFGLTMYGYAVADPPPLTLEAAQNLGAKVMTSKFLSSDFQTTANSTNADTQLTFERENILPATHMMNTDDEDTVSLVKVGVRKTLNMGDNAAAQQRAYYHALQIAQKKRHEDQQLLKRQKIGESWLEFYYWSQAKQFVPRLPAANVAVITEQYQLAQNNLAHWIHINPSSRPLPSTLPVWPDLPPLKTLQQQLALHPKLQADAATVSAMQIQVDLNKIERRPCIEVGASYGVKQQDMLNADPRLDMVSGELRIKLPNSTQSVVQDSLSDVNNLARAEAKQRQDSQALLKALNNQYSKWRVLQAAWDNRKPPSPLDANAPLVTLRLAVDLAITRVNLQYFQPLTH
ncbi:MAG: hypothetical protein QM752_06935 [Gammaproteobacteria bacterium]